MGVRYEHPKWVCDMGIPNGFVIWASQLGAGMWVLNTGIPNGCEVWPSQLGAGCKDPSWVWGCRRTDVSRVDAEVTPPSLPGLAAVGLGLHQADCSFLWAWVRCSSTEKPKAHPHAAVGRSTHPSSWGAAEAGMLSALRLQVLERMSEGDTVSAWRICSWAVVGAEAVMGSGLWLGSCQELQGFLHSVEKREGVGLGVLRLLWHQSSSFPWLCWLLKATGTWGA